MSYKILTLTILFGIVFLPLVSSAQVDINENAGTRSMAFLKIGVGAKAIGMGSSHVASVSDLFASYWNPAGLSQMQRSQLGFMYNRWIEDINYGYISYAHPVVGLGVIATSVAYLSYGELDGRDEQGNEEPPFRPFDLAVILSYSRNFTPDIALGINAKWLREQIDDNDAQAYAFDIGGLYILPGSKLALGANLQHLGTKVKFIEESFSLPLNLKLGIAYKLLNDSLTMAVDLNKPTDDDVNLSFGMEFAPIEMLYLRTGYRYSLNGNDLGAVSGLSAGFGASIESYRIDYAFVHFEKFGLTHRVSVLANF